MGSYFANFTAILQLFVWSVKSDYISGVIKINDDGLICLISAGLSQTVINKSDANFGKPFP